MLFLHYYWNTKKYENFPLSQNWCHLHCLFGPPIWEHHSHVFLTLCCPLTYVAIIHIVDGRSRSNCSFCKYLYYFLKISHSLLLMLGTLILFIYNYTSTLQVSKYCPHLSLRPLLQDPWSMSAVHPQPTVLHARIRMFQKTVHSIQPFKQHLLPAFSLHPVEETWLILTFLVPE